ncbi:MAG TPA: allantoate amidohydrolase [Acidimicrobiales bacterium]|nr:allantoate amidohydrolase [Acidimicrobiales bacterium]
MNDLLARFQETWAELAPVGRRQDGGYDRFAWSDADLELRAWFRRQAAERGLAVEQDRNGNLWAWWGHDPGEGLPPVGALAVGSHLDSVPGGGAYDGPLGVVAAFLALDVLRARGGARGTPVAIVDFTEEEGARFGVACLGSRLSVAAVDPERARGLTDSTGTSLADAMRAAGADPEMLGDDRVRLSRLAAFVELHVEQGRHLGDVGAPVGVASEIWPHGRWRFRFEGEANHAGTARLVDRKDPMLAFAAAVVKARESAAFHLGLATFGRATVQPNATNAVAASVEAWLDARAPVEGDLEAIVDAVRAEAAAAARLQGVTVAISEESRTPAVTFDPSLRARVGGALDGTAPEMATGAGHDAGILAAVVPTAMLFVRNPSGVSHGPGEHASDEDCVAGVRDLARVLGLLLS